MLILNGFSQIKYDKKQNKVIDFILNPFPINSKVIQPDPEIKKIIDEYFNQETSLKPALNPI